jgi:hypothetical protein
MSRLSTRAFAAKLNHVVNNTKNSALINAANNSGKPSASNSIHRINSAEYCSVHAQNPALLGVRYVDNMPPHLQQRKPIVQIIEQN